MHIEVVENQVNFLGGGIGMLKQSFYEADEIRLGSAFGTFTTRCPPLGSTATNMLQVPKQHAALALG